MSGPGDRRSRPRGGEGVAASAVAVRFSIDRTWDGRPADPSEAGRVELVPASGRLVVLVDAPFHGDPPPVGPPGSTERLWEHEAAEVFLVGRGAAYLEIELGPFGHFLVLELRGERNVVRRGLPIAYSAEIDGSRWRARAELDEAYLPPGIASGNAYLLHGTGEARRHLAAFPVPGDRPDFHRIEYFPAIRLA